MLATRCEIQDMSGCDYGANGRIVGARPMCGLPTPDCAVIILRVDSDIVPQQSFFGQ